MVKWAAKFGIDPDESGAERKVRMARARETGWHHYLLRQELIRAATPPWCDKGAIKRIYEECRKMSKETGIKHEVDHIVPINHERVCGLHVHYNLRIISKRENAIKANKLVQEISCGFNEQGV